jgi:catechol 2,3-dioxygenase-like lactoylglutathione lyase family enzyme
MNQNIVHIALVVDDYDEAIKFYTEKLNFTLVEDTVQSETKRWVKVAPKGAEECCLLLAKGVGEEQRSRIGNQTGGRVFLFLKTDDFWRDYKNMPPRHNFCQRTEKRGIRNGRRFRRFIRQSLGFG